MPIIDFSSTKGNNLIFLSESEILELITNKRYRINKNFFENSLMIMLNGQQLEKGSTNDYVMIDDNTFELTFTKHNRSKITVGFLEK